MKAMILKELKLVRKDKRSFFFLLLMPALFIVMFGSIFNSGGDASPIEIHTVDQDGSAASAALMKQLGGVMDVKPDNTSALDDQLAKIQRGQFSALLVIPQGFEAALKRGEQAPVQLYQDPAAASETAPIQAILGSIATQYREQKLEAALLGAGETKEQAAAALASPLDIATVETTSDNFNYIDQIVPGMTVMFVFFIMITMARRFFEEKRTGLLSRIRSTSIRPLQYLIGMWIPFVMTVIAQCLVLFAFGHFAYDLRMGDPLALGAIVLGLSIAGTGIGLGLSFIVPGESAAMVITQLISMGGSLVGGLWMPSYLLPAGVQTVGHFTPQYWAQHSLLDVIAHGAHLGDVLGAVGVLLLFGLLGLTVAVVRLPRFLRSAAS